MSLLRALLAFKPVRTPLEFGINENVRLVAIDNSERTRDGEKISRNTYMTFSQYNPENKKIASTEFSYYNLDHSSEFVKDNLIQQIAQLNDICQFFGVKGQVDPTADFEDIQELLASLKTKDGCKALMESMWKQFSELVGDLVGEDSPLARLKVITDSKGKYLQLPKDSHIIEPISNECKLSISSYELKMKAKGLTDISTAEADAKGEAPGAAPKKKSSLAGL